MNQMYGFEGEVKSKYPFYNIFYMCFLLVVWFNSNAFRSTTNFRGMYCYFPVIWLINFV